MNTRAVAPGLNRSWCLYALTLLAGLATAAVATGAVQRVKATGGAHSSPGSAGGGTVKSSETTTSPISAPDDLRIKDLREP